jgi:hypothetical protein
MAIEPIYDQPDLYDELLPTTSSSAGPTPICSAAPSIRSSPPAPQSGRWSWATAPDGPNAIDLRNC